MDGNREGGWPLRSVAFRPLGLAYRLRCFILYFFKVVLFEGHQGLFTPWGIDPLPGWNQSPSAGPSPGGGFLYPINSSGDPLPPSQRRDDKGKVSFLGLVLLEISLILRDLVRALPRGCHPRPEGVPGAGPAPPLLSFSGIFGTPWSAAPVAVQNLYFTLLSPILRIFVYIPPLSRHPAGGGTPGGDGHHRTPSFLHSARLANLGAR